MPLATAESLKDMQCCKYTHANAWQSKYGFQVSELSVPAVVAAVIFLGESFSITNGVGLFVLICGVALFNVNKYRKMLSGQAKGAPAMTHAPQPVPAQSAGLKTVGESVPPTN